MNGEFINGVNDYLILIITLAIILLDYRRKSNQDMTQRRLLSLAMVFAMAVMSSDLIYLSVMGRPGNFVHVFCWITNTLYYLFQTAAAGALALFLNYSAQKNIAMLRKRAVTVGLIQIANIIALVFNLLTGYIFTITPDNVYTELFIAVPMLIAYLLIAIIIYDAFANRKQMSRNYFPLVLISTGPVFAGSLLELFVPGLMLTVPCFFLSLVFSYLFIVRLDMVKAMDDKLEAEQLAYESELAKEHANTTINALESTQRAVTAIFESNPHMNVMFDNNFKVLDCNPAACRYIGVETREELLAGFSEWMTKLDKYSKSG